jgi:glycosyltransferase involved in cell wall biosynthesis
MPLTLHLWLRAPLLALYCFLLRMQLYMPRFLRAVGKKRGTFRYSVVTAVYNAERWLPAFFTSLFCQRLDTERALEIICVDDGSSDRSAEVIKRWQKCYPSLIVYMRKDNAGAASARNLGLEAATGEWVTFMDADDFVHPGYFSAVDDYLKRFPDSATGMLICNYLMFNDWTGAYRNSHFLRHRFEKGEQRIDAGDTGSLVQVVTNSVFFPRLVLMQHGIRQKEDVRPTFEDGEMLLRYVPLIDGMFIGILPQAKYYHRRYKDGSSLTGKAYSSRKYYETPLALGCLRPLREMREVSGTVPLFAQMTVLHALSRYYQKIFAYDSYFQQLDANDKARFFALAREILTYITPEVIESADMPYAHPAFKDCMLKLYKK